MMRPSNKRKRGNKQERERQILIGLVEHYLQTGRPVGSHTLQEAGFEMFSSATIRNYFSHLEEEGYLCQQHSSGGRLPTEKAYRLYIKEPIEREIPLEVQQACERLRCWEGRDVVNFLQQGAELISHICHGAIFLSLPRFDQDFVTDLKLMPLDAERCLGVILTDFGLVRSEVLQLPYKLSALSAKRMEAFFKWRLTQLERPENLTIEEECLANQLYHELMIRYVVNYSQFYEEDLIRTGFSQLLQHPDFHETELMSRALGLFENGQSLRKIIQQSLQANQLQCWIGEDLKAFSPQPPFCSLLTIPYYVGPAPVGTIGLLSSQRCDYHMLFAILQNFSKSISEALSHNIYKYKLSFRFPLQQPPQLEMNERQLLGQTPLILIEDKRV